MDQGFPGALKMYVTYELLEDGFKINYNATPDKDTIINVTNHSYFNLNGEGSGTVLNHSVKYMQTALLLLTKHQFLQARLKL